MALKKYSRGVGLKPPMRPKGNEPVEEQYLHDLGERVNTLLTDLDKQKAGRPIHLDYGRVGIATVGTFNLHRFAGASGTLDYGGTFGEGYIVGVSGGINNTAQAEADVFLSLDTVVGNRLVTVVLGTNAFSQKLKQPIRYKDRQLIGVTVETKTGWAASTGWTVHLHLIPDEYEIAT